jgi:hypothetical protein
MSLVTKQDLLPIWKRVPAAGNQINSLVSLLFLFLGFSPLFFPPGYPSLLLIFYWLTSYSTLMFSASLSITNTVYSVQEKGRQMMCL